MVLCSVIVPSLNQGRFLGESLESILSQSHAGLRVEALVMDGGSTDETAAVARSFRRGGRVTFVSEPDRGQSHAINKGLARARGTYWTWLCADDAYEPGGLGRLVEALEQDPDAVLAYGCVLKVDEAGRVLDVHTARREPTREGLLHTSTYIQQAGTLLRAARVREVGPLDETLHYAMDLDLWLRMLNGRRGVALPQWCVARARSHAAAKSVAQARAMADQTMRVRWRHGAPLVGEASWTYARWRYVNLPLGPLKTSVRRVLHLGEGEA
jgi:glycosyltransferase involved in cell wall biosynthesis